MPHHTDFAIASIGLQGAFYRLIDAIILMISADFFNQLPLIAPLKDDKVLDIIQQARRTEHSL